MNTKSVVSLCFLGLAGSAWAADAKPEPKDVKVLEQIVAKVNGDIITQGELDRTKRLVEAELQRQSAPADKLQKAIQQLQRDLLRDRIDEILLVQKAKDLNISADQDVSKQMAALQKDSGITDPDEFRR